GEKNDGVPGHQGHDARGGAWLLGTNETGGRHEPDPGRTTGGIGMQYQTADVPDAEPCHRRGLRIEVRETEHHAAHAEQRGVAAPDEIRERLARITIQRSDGRMCRRRSLLAVAEAVDDRDQGPFPGAFDQREIAGLHLPRQRQGREPRLNLQIARRHFFIVMVVPCPTTDCTSNSSIRRFAPGRPAPTPCEVEYPYCIARSMSGIPGP